MSIRPAIVLASLPAAAQAQPSEGWTMMHDGWVWWMSFHGLLSLAMVGAVIVGIVVLVRYLFNGKGSSGRADRRTSAMDQLDERYSRGEIDRDDYLQRKRDLSGG